uniref:Peptidase A2 domain-containing protein n=1 Tax=Anopheles funestus TaxID=62324 RepID=A0A182S0D3_ANOFN
MPKTRRSTQRLVHSTELEHEKQFTMTEMQKEHDKSLSMLQAQHEKEMALQKQLYEMQISHEKELRMCEVRFKEELEKAQKGSGNVAASTPNVTIADVEDLSPAQFAARKVVNKKLPKYRGEPDRWPLFYSSYINSSKACGYSNIENLTRLIECLEGEAMEAVQGYLIRPESVPEAIEVLKELFGSPGKVLKSLLHQVRQLPAPTEKNLESFIKFSLKVKQLNEHITACELTEHADNPLLVEELVIKLPISDQREWVRYKKDKTGHRLALFTSYLQEVMRETNEVLSFRSTPSEPTQSTAKKRETIPITLYNGDKQVNTMAFIDEGSSATLIEEGLADALHADGKVEPLKNGIPVETVHATLRQQQQIIANNVAFVKSPLKQEEYEKAERLLIRQAQIDGFLDEYRILERRQNYPMDNWITLEKSSPLYKLSTMMDHH